MGGGECALGDAAIGEETLNYDGDDVEMADAGSDTEEALAAEVSAATGGAAGGGGHAEKDGPEGKKKKRKKRNKGKKNKGRQDGAPTTIADINR
jgi:phosphorylated adapter RNA export protein